MDHYPTTAEVERVAAVSDPVVRNLQITQSYSELAAALARRTGSYANWCTFATWASKQAGQTIRHEDLLRLLERGLAATPAARQAAAGVTAAARPGGARAQHLDIGSAVGRALFSGAAAERASAAVARGNLKVFAEIGREFARFASDCLPDTVFEAQNLERFCAGLRPGEPPDGQRYLRQAFTRYYQAFFETAPKARAELMLLANLEIGLHEQTRLQPEIAEALEVVVVDPDQFTRAVLGMIFPFGGWLVYALLLGRRLLRRPAPLDTAIQHLLAVVRQQTRQLLTEHLMTLGLPHGRQLRLGADLRAEFPEALRQIAHPELRALLTQIDPTPDSLRETGAVDWADLPERLHFIADLFRCLAEAPELTEPPFSPEQVVELKAGRRPGGPL